MTAFSGDLFDGRSSQAHPVSASLDAGWLRITGEDIALAFPLDHLRFVFVHHLVHPLNLSLGKDILDDNKPAQIERE